MNSEFRVLCLGLELGLQRADRSLIPEDRVVRKLQESVQKSNPVTHRHGDLSLRPVLGQIEVGGDYSIEFTNVVGGQIVLRDRNARLQDLSLWGILPASQSHMRLLSVGV